MTTWPSRSRSRDNCGAMRALLRRSGAGAELLRFAGVNSISGTAGERLRARTLTETKTELARLDCFLRTRAGGVP